MTESPDTVIVKPIKLHLRILHVLLRCLNFVGRLAFKAIYGNEGERLPLIIDDLLRKPATEIAELIRDKKIKSEQVLEKFICRIKEVNPALNCFVEDRFNEALEEARAADAAIASGTKTKEELALEKPFLGVPFTTKDCIAVKGLLQTAGVTIRRDVRATEDAPTIHKLREAGAIPLGITNVPELCMWYESHNHIHGRTNNPYNTLRIVGGSSGGEACLQAAAGSAFGIGSDIGGSIRMPCFFNGIFGHKPSRYIVSNDGNYPNPQNEMQNSFLGVGPMTRHASDLKPIFKIIAGDNSKKLRLDEPVDIANLKIYYRPDNHQAPLVDPVDKEIKLAMHKAINHLADKVKNKPEQVKIELLQKSNPIWLATMRNKTSFAKLITGKDSTMNIICEIFKHIFGLSSNTVIGLFTALFENTTPKIDSDRYKHYVELRQKLETQFKEILKDDGVLLYPTHPVPAPYHNEPLMKPFNFCYTSIINCMGLPATHVPLGLNSEGLPIGIQVIANHDNDRLTIAVAEELEKAFGGWVEPQKDKKLD